MGLLDVAGSLLQTPQPAPKFTIREITTLSLSWKDKKTGETQFVRFDTISSETHESLMSITSHPVEEGANVVDHARPEPKRLSIEGYVSNKPLLSNPGVERLMEFSSIPLDVKEYRPQLLPTPGSITRTITAGIDAALKPKPSKATVLHALGGTMPDRAKTMYTLLAAAQQARQLITISTNLEQLENMLIERLSVPRTLGDGNGATFQIEFVNVRIVKSETVDAPLPAEARGAGENAKGSKSAKDGDKKAAEELKSVAAGLFDGGAAAIGKLPF